MSDAGPPPAPYGEWEGEPIVTDRFGRDRWLRRLRGVGVVIPVVGALAAGGLAGLLARHDAAAASLTGRSSSSTSATPTHSAAQTPTATTTRRHVRKHTAKREHTAKKPKRSLTSAPTDPPVTHSGGS